MKVEFSLEKKGQLKDNHQRNTTILTSTSTMQPIQGAIRTQWSRDTRKSHLINHELLEGGQMLFNFMLENAKHIA